MSESRDFDHWPFPMHCFWSPVHHIWVEEDGVSASGGVQEKRRECWCGSGRKWGLHAELGEVQGPKTRQRALGKAAEPVVMGKGHLD